ncbi:hypothetical protein GUITHDRAFT_140978 [Guillardia theta CCMP2712]|uniref:Uncharacterized protein n=1 Tax=Guillardia theta (strain CCMP2712) TaxID=905079 RepID=L1J2U7_GUITC|nr:hypothetical protein GUITHDRAFT_140978 [Guillardia theta CCMP2712]EKX42843.1 hypothetical protein GUITHDRAFT_140978 [Guillardia theta CCMP2712]|eukprot:XP_005829823.1 hypothetical protein GUITHDRAFT_140978 [Guillardia theta CCMP2712]
MANLFHGLTAAMSSCFLGRLQLDPDCGIPALRIITAVERVFMLEEEKMAEQGSFAHESLLSPDVASLVVSKIQSHALELLKLTNDVDPVGRSDMLFDGDVVEAASSSISGMTSSVQANVQRAHKRRRTAKMEGKSSSQTMMEQTDVAVAPELLSASFHLIESAVMVCGSVLDGSVRREVSSKVIAYLLLSYNQTAFLADTARQQGEVRLAALKVAWAILLAPVNVPPASGLVMRVFRFATQDPCVEVRSFSSLAIQALPSLMHPRAPTIFLPSLQAPIIESQPPSHPQRQEETSRTPLLPSSSHDAMEITSDVQGATQRPKEAPVAASSQAHRPAALAAADAVNLKQQESMDAEESKRKEVEAAKRRQAAEAARKEEEEAARRREAEEAAKRREAEAVRRREAEEKARKEEAAETAKRREQTASTTVGKEADVREGATTRAGEEEVEMRTADKLMPLKEDKDGEDSDDPQLVMCSPDSDGD